MINYILKYGTSNLIIIYYYAYSGLSDTTVYVIQNSIKLIRGTKSSSWVVSQTSFSLYLHNQWTNFHKLSCAGKP